MGTATPNISLLIFYGVVWALQLRILVCLSFMKWCGHRFSEYFYCGISLFALKAGPQFTCNAYDNIITTMLTKTKKETLHYITPYPIITLIVAKVPSIVTKNTDCQIENYHL